MQFYFTASAADVVRGAITDPDVQLHIHTAEERNPHAAWYTTRMLHLLLRGTEFEGFDNIFRAALSTNPDLHVGVEIVFLPSAYRRLRFSPCSHNKSAHTDRTEDALNYAAFVEAVDLIYSGSGFGREGFPDSVKEYKHWAHYNVTAIDQENSSRPPDRRQRGNGNTDRVWPENGRIFPAARADPAVRSLLRTYLIAAQQFMNFCEDLSTLAGNLDETDTREALARVMDQTRDLVKEGAGQFPLSFSKPLIAALVNQCGRIVKNVHASPPGGTGQDTFGVQITVS